MSEFKYRCGHCAYTVRFSDSLPGNEEAICPRCGWGANDWLPTPMDKARGRRFRYFVTDEVCRAGRVRQQLKFDGLFHSDTTNGELEDADAYTARISFQPGNPRTS